MAADRQAPYRWPEWAGLAALAAGIAVIYRPALRGPLLLDDHASIEHNASLAHWSTALFPPPAAGVGGRPLLNLSFAFNAHFGGYHLLNLLIHILAAWTLYALVRRTATSALGLGPTQDRAAGATFGPRRALAGGAATAFAAAALWAWHPLATEAVSYLSQRAESLMALWYLLTLLCFARARHVAATLCCLAGMLTQETMATAPIAVLLYDRVFVSGSFAAAWRAHRKPLLALAATWIPLAWLAAGLAQRQVGFATGMPWWHYARVECFAVVHYVRLAIWPRLLVFDYGPQAYLGASGLGLRLGALALLAAATVFLWRRKPAAGFCLAAFLLILAPTSTLIPIASQPVAESRMYLPLAALAVLATIAVVSRFGRGGTIALILAALGLGCAAEQRNYAYMNATTLWRDTIAKAPANYRAYENLGYALEAEALESNADPSAMPGPPSGGLRSVRNESDGPKARSMTDLRAQDLSLSVGGGPSNPGAVGSAKLAAAADQYRHALALNPRSAETHTNLGSVLARLGQPSDALAEFEAALRIDPEFAAARADLAILREDLGNALAAQGRFAAAAHQFSASIAADGSRDSAHYDLANALKRLPGREAAAAAEYEAALRLNPARAETHNNYANLLLAQGRIREAIAHYQEALRLKPDFTSARLNLERAEGALRN